MGESCGSGTHKHEECCGGSTKHEMKEEHKHGSCETPKKDQKDSCCG